jgi:hypothetical protein
VVDYVIGQRMKRNGHMRWKGEGAKLGFDLNGEWPLVSRPIAIERRRKPPGPAQTFYPSQAAVRRMAARLALA